MNEETLFHAALAKLPTERAAFLDQACAGQPALRAAVEALLAAHEGPGSLLDPLPAELDQTIESHAGRERPAAADDRTQQYESATPAGPKVARTTEYCRDAQPGGVIAERFTLQEKIGEGGMGEVWVAKQTAPVKRKVAIKLIKTGMDSRAVLQRFEQERQALAMMDHPSIARVLDGGMTPSGQPFFVMELVNGLTLDKFCDDARLSPKERLELFIPICQAVQHAHQKGIVHRDLKPANILVTMVDGRPVPKVIDFGVAKATAGKLTEETMSTGFGAIVGTLEYMSPEQAGFSNVDIDTRSDIYSLGVILYELLTGLRPIDAQRLRQAALTEMIRIIREEEPSKPSTRLSTNASLPSLAAMRHIEPKKLMALLRGDLDWVVMKCLDKQRERRYETASGLAREIQRYLDGEAVEACPPSVGYRLNKFVRRNKGQVIAASLVLLTLVGGVVGTSIGLVQANVAVTNEKAAAAREKTAREQETVQRAAAEKARDRTRDVLDAMVSEVTGDSLTTQKEISAEQKKFLESVLGYYREFAGENPNDERSRARQAHAASRVIMVEYRLGRIEESAAANRIALEGFATLATDFPTVPDYRAKLAESHRYLGVLLFQLSEVAAAGEEFRKAVAIQEQLVADFPDVSRYRADLAGSHGNLGLLLFSLGQGDAAAEEYRKCLEIQAKLVADFPDVPQYRPDLAKSHANMAGLLTELGRGAAAEEQYSKALVIEEKLAAEFPDVPRYRSELALSHNNLGVLLQALRPGAAEEQFREALEIQEKLALSFPAVPQYRSELALSRTNLGNLLVDLGQGAMAEEQYRKALAIHEKLAADFSAVSEYQLDLGGSYCNFGNLIRNGGDLVESMKWLDRAVDCLKTVYEKEPRDVTAKRYLRNSYEGRALTFEQLQKFVEAAKDWDQAIALSPSAEQLGYRDWALHSRVSAGMLSEAVTEVAELTKSSNWDADQWYNFACVYAVASGQSADKETEYADRAMEFLTTAVEAGWNDAAQMKVDPDLDPFREREDFKKLLAELEKKFQPMREVIPPPKEGTK